MMEIVVQGSNLEEVAAMAKRLVAQNPDLSPATDKGYDMRGGVTTHRVTISKRTSMEVREVNK